jgi:hypothetical protein
MQCTALHCTADLYGDCWVFFDIWNRFRNITDTFDMQVITTDLNRVVNELVKNILDAQEMKKRMAHPQGERMDRMLVSGLRYVFDFLTG